VTADTVLSGSHSGHDADILL